MNRIRINPQIEIEDIRHTDLHMHTIWCDGTDTPQAMVESAMEKGFTCIGFSGHSYVAFDPAAGMDEKRFGAYIREVRRLQEAYAGKIRILCGIELDYHSLPEHGTKSLSALRNWYRETFDYIIGSVHYIPLPTQGGDAGGGYAAVDDTPEILIEAVRNYYDGDYYRAAQNYYRLVGDVAEHTGCDIIGHFDLFSKFNQKYSLFDETHPRYQEAWKKAADQLSAAGCVFEINTGGISRGWRDVPYPAPQMREYIEGQGGRFLLSSDSHRKDTIGYLFDRF